jgi:hypothetical protein
MTQVTIQHHPQRPRYLSLLIDLLKPELENVSEFTVVSDDVSSASGMKKAFESIKRSDHLLVLQDDILPCRDLIATAELLSRLRPNAYISLFNAHPVVSQAVSQRKSWATLDVAWGTCAYLLPTSWAQDYLAFDSKIKQRIKADDVRLSTYLQVRGEPVYVTAPSLVDHICWYESSESGERVPLDNCAKFRVADYYIGFERSGLDVDWLAGFDNPALMTMANPFDPERNLAHV